MESERREQVVLYQVPLLAEFQLKSIIINALPQAQLAPQHIHLRKKEGKYQVSLMVPASKVQEICALKELTINKDVVCIKRSFTEAQVFIGRIPDGVSIEDIRAYLEGEFGKIQKIQEGTPHEETKTKLRHCYIQFSNEEDAEKCLFSTKKLMVKAQNQPQELKASRNYAMNESDETDKKLFLKIITQYDDQDDLERAINQQFRKEGKLREKIRVESGKATIVYTSAEVADRVLHNFKAGKIGKYEVILRPFGTKDNYTVFVAGLKLNVNQQELEQAFKHYENVISCSILTGSNPTIRNGTLTFGCQETYKRLLVEYKEDPLIKDIFVTAPYVTQHMNAKDRNDYNSFKRGKAEPKKTTQGPMIPPPMAPMGFNFYPQMQQMQQISFMPGRLPMGNFGFSSQP